MIKSTPNPSRLELPELEHRPLAHGFCCRIQHVRAGVWNYCLKYLPERYAFPPLSLPF